MKQFFENLIESICHDKTCRSSTSYIFLQLIITFCFVLLRDSLHDMIFVRYLSTDFYAVLSYRKLINNTIYMLLYTTIRAHTGIDSLFNTLTPACTAGGSHVPVPWGSVHCRWVTRVCSVGSVHSAVDETIARSNNRSISFAEVSSLIRLKSSTSYCRNDIR